MNEGLKGIEVYSTMEVYSTIYEQELQKTIEYVLRVENIFAYEET